MSERNARLLEGVAPDAPLLEIGPSFNPVAAKSAGWQVTIVDHASQAELVAKYAGGAVDTGLIEPVDVVWAGGPLHAAVPAELHGRYAALIACHVVEHLPDLIGFLRSAEALLDPRHGAVLLAVPDKRLCFDFFRPPSTTGQFIAAHRARQGRHTPRAMFDHVAYSATDGGRAGWGQQVLGELRLEHTLEQAVEQMDLAETNEGYTNCHGWQFTPASFELLVLEFGALGLTDWRVEWLEPRPAVEFLARLVRGREVFASPEVREARRLELLKRMVLEQRDQAERLLASPPVPAPEPRLDGIEAMLRQMRDAQLPAITAELGATRAALVPVQDALAELRPVGAAMAAMLPVRRAIARMRGRL
ncbi:MAG: methyltransferase domain-containing protein [Paracraurococcus sp.]